MERLKYWGMAVTSGLIMAIAWPETAGLTFLIFFALVGLLSLEDTLSKKSRHPGKAVFAYAYVSFFIFNLVTTWWIYHASAWGAVAAILFNSLFMAVVFWLFHISKQKIGKRQGYFALVFYWLAFEYLHLNWDLSWPWLTLGNVFANTPKAVQWYEYTGVLGGSLWVLVANLIVFFALQYSAAKRKIKAGATFLLWAAIILGIHFWSRAQYFDFKAEVDGKTVNVVLVQPNIDPYHDKFGGMDEKEQIDRMIDLSREKLSDSTDLLILPETAFPSAYWEHQVDGLYGTLALEKIIEDYPKLRVIVGLSTSVLFEKGEDVPAVARKVEEGLYAVNYNTAMQLDSSESIIFHHKSKLVLGVEKVPFLKYFPWMKKLSINLGGASGGYGTQEHPTVFFDENNNNGIAPIICYESVYGEYVNEYAKRGAELYAIITNDGWWDNSPGYQQHLAYARLRAIEGRKNIVRSANTGISAIINSRGDIIKQTKWWIPDALKGKAKLNNSATFYIRYGDYIGRVASFVAVLLILLTIVKELNKTEQRLKI